ncbi:MAG: flavohemoglobin expression-modulating QEGLA motif protein [Oleiphilus sp.]|nr:MAG: flavohemoglobin expression-modulating QEGLA motif protein [Oleiphilus sp.]
MTLHEPHSTVLTELDSALFEAVRGVDILGAVTPLNFRHEREAFFASGFAVNPDFIYEAHSFDHFARKRALYALPVENLVDEDLIRLYSDVIGSYADKLDQFRSVGTADFLYDSMRYYGEPSDKDMRNAHFILHLPDDLDQRDDASLGADDIVARLEAFASREGYEYQIRLDDSMIANALVSGTVIKVNRMARVAETEVNALLHHELGVHLVTTLNARNQPLRVLSLGCPVNTTTQEGLAILCEYLAGFMTLPRLKVLALRVLAVHSMIHEKDFKTTFMMLKEQYQVADELAFTITARVYRGGGLTKDYLYLQGLHQMLNAYESEKDFKHLLCGKVSLEYLGLVTRLIEKGYLIKPGFVSPAIAKPVQIDEVSRFIAHAIK